MQLGLVSTEYEAIFVSFDSAVYVRDRALSRSRRAAAAADISARQSARRL